MLEHALLEQPIHPFANAAATLRSATVTPSCSSGRRALHSTTSPPSISPMKRASFVSFFFSLRDRDAALSLTQDTFLKAWRARDSFRGDCAVGTWLMRIAVNLLRDHTRTETFRFWKRAASTAVDAADLSLGLTQSSSSAESLLIAQQKLAAVWVTVGELSTQQRAVFLLRFIEEMELSEIAAALEMNLATVKTHLHRGLEKVRTAHGNAARSKS